MKKLIVLDLDGTLAVSKSSLDTEMLALLNDLLSIVKVAVISGGDWSQFEKQLIKHTEELKDKSKKISELIYFHFRYFDKNPETTSIIFSEDIFRNGKFIREKLLNIISERCKIICNALEDAKQSHEFKGINTFQLANIILEFIRFTVLEWRLSGYKYSILEKGKRETKTIMKLINNNN